MRSTRHARLVTLAGVAASAGAVNLLSSVRADTPPPVVDVWTWGLGTSGQLGPARLNSTIPAANHTEARWVAVSAGSEHTIALTDTGEVLAWGDNGKGQLGDGTTTTSMLPVQVAGLTGITAIAAGGFHNLAYRASDAKLWGWGDNGSGQLGKDPVVLPTSPVPIEITGLGALKGFAGGGAHSVALSTDGTVFTWGTNLYGQLGTGDFAPRVTPTPVTLPGPASAVGAGGSHSLAALATGGAVYTWGWNVFGQLGRGYQGTPELGEPTPAPALGVTDVVEVTGGDLHCLGRTTDGHVWGWGYNTEGQVGNGAVTAANSGVLTPGLLDIDSVALVDAGGVHSIALKTNGEVWTWGGNQFGQSGNNGRADELRPVRPIEIGTARAVTAGGKHSVALAATVPKSHVVELGGSALGGIPSARPAVRTVASLAGVVTMSAGARHVLAIDGDHRLWAWGDNSKEQLGVTGPGTDDPREVPAALDGARGFVAVAAGADRSFALRSDGIVWAWGDNTDGVLGTGATSSPSAPTPVQGLTGIIAIAAGERHCLAQDNHGTVWGWGENDNGQLGIPASAIATAPVVIPYLVGPQRIDAAGWNSVALGGVGEVLVWGAGFRGQLGSGNLGGSAVPVEVGLPHGATVVSAGRVHTLVVLAGGDVWGFGDNALCQLGVSPLVYPFTYAPLDLGLRDALAVRAGEYHSLALNENHDVLAWGDDSGGQLGRSDTTRVHYDCDVAGVGLHATSALAATLGGSAIATEDVPSASDAGGD